MASIVVLIAGYHTHVSWRDWPQLLLVFGLMVFASLIRVESPGGFSVTPTTVLTYLSIYVFNPPTAALVVGVSRALGFALSRGWVPWRAVFNGSQAGLSAALGSYVFMVLGGRPDAPAEIHVYVAAFAAPLANHLTNYFLVGFGVSQIRGTSVMSTWITGVKDLLLPNLLSMCTAYVLALFYVRNHAAALVYLVLLPFQWMALRLYVTRRQLYAQIVDGLVVAADANFPLGRGHARRVADIGVAIAREMRLSETDVASVQFAALLHDVGMIGKDDLLDKPLLSEEEQISLRDHVNIGAEMARELPRREIAEGIRYHHERYDGAGYPTGLKGKAIPLVARIVALAEAVDSLGSQGLDHQPVNPKSAVLEYVLNERGRAFDPDVVDAFAKVVEAGRVGLGWEPVGTRQTDVVPHAKGTPA
ncbi:MAG: HD domain-containing protein [Armatimonadota bacterium]|nr:HD domain-containing protein [Armatimonadota bacterium]